MNYKVNIIDIEQALLDLGGESGTRNIQNRILEQYCGGLIPDNYKSDKSFRQTIQRKIEDYCPQAEGFDPLSKEAKFIRIGRGLYRIGSGRRSREFPAIEEVDAAEQYVEGSTKTIAVNYYERNPEARKKCIEYYGVKCIACGFDFQNVYGEIGKAFIHVHHIVPLSEIRTSYIVDPIRDLNPVCANCHSMIHRVSPALSIDQLRNALNQQNQRLGRPQTD